MEGMEDGMRACCLKSFLSFQEAANHVEMMSLRLIVYEVFSCALKRLSLPTNCWMDSNILKRFIFIFIAERLPDMSVRPSKAPKDIWTDNMHGELGT